MVLQVGGTVIQNAVQGWSRLVLIVGGHEFADDQQRQCIGLALIVCGEIPAEQQVSRLKFQ